MDVPINTDKKMLIDEGEAWAEYHDQTVHAVHSRRVECDEIWSFCYAKDKNVKKAKAAPVGAGDVWTWTALDVDSRIIIAYEIGDRTIQTAIEFQHNLRSRLDNRVQLNTDGLKAYYEAVDMVFGSELDYAQLVKNYGDADDAKEKRYNPSKCIDTRKRRVFGNPDLDELSTSYVERHNLSMRMGIRRFTRLTNTFRKKLEHHLYMLACISCITTS